MAKKLTRIVRFRWKLVLVIAVAGAVVGAVVTQRLNQSMTPEFRGITTVAVDVGTQNDRNREATPDSILAAQDRANQANADLLAAGGGIVTADTRTNQIVFTARGASEDEARSTAEMMRSSYIDATASAESEARQQRLEEISLEAADVLAQINELSPPEEEPVAPEVDADVQARLATLESLVTALTQQTTKLEIDLILAEAGNDRVGTPADIQRELDGVSERLDEIYAEMAQITLETGLEPGRGSGGTSGGTSAGPGSTSTNESRESNLPEQPLTPDAVIESWTLEALEERYQALASEFESLFLAGRQQQQEEPAAASVEDLTRTPGSILVNGGLAFAFAFVVGIVAAFAEAQVRGRIFVPADTAPVSTLAELPASGPMIRAASHRRFSLRRSVNAVFARRMDGVRRLRAVLVTLAETSNRSLAIGLSGVEISHHETRMLAMDLARRIGSADRRVLVLDLDFDVDWPYREPDSPLTVAALTAAIRTDPESGAAAMKRTVGELMETETHVVIGAGPISEDSADLVLTAGFERMLESARELADFLLVITPSASHPATVALGPRLDGTIAVCGVGRSTRKGLMALRTGTPDDTGRLGVALLTGRLTSGQPWRGRISLSRFLGTSSQHAAIDGALDDIPRPDEAVSIAPPLQQ
jgi:hypothetical protein